MSTQPDKYAEMHLKLREGLQILSDAAEGDSYRLGMALIKLHGALEDYIRLEVARRAPSLRAEVEDARKTTWKDLIGYGKQYLRFSEMDARTITDANIQRQRVAHGKNYEKSRASLVSYAQFVERWCGSPRPATGELRPRPVTAPARPAPPPREPPLSQGKPARPWYRTTPFLILSFFLLPPVWAALILTDRNQGCLLRLVAAASAVLQLSLGAILLSPSSSLVIDSLQFLVEPFSAPSIMATAPPTAEETPARRNATPAEAVTAPSSTDNVCSVVWVEHPANDLAGKNRSMVWFEIVMSQVEGSGMTARQFFDQVVERNPELAQDGYEFKEDKLYLLPECR
jgi:hypothetical protein